MAKISRVDKKSYHRVKHKRPTPVRIVDATVSGTLLTLKFDQAVEFFRKKTPLYLTDVVDAEPVSAVLSDPVTLKITYSESIDAATEVIIPYDDQSVRTTAGGFVADTTFRLAA